MFGAFWQIAELSEHITLHILYDTTFDFSRWGGGETGHFIIYMFLSLVLSIVLLSSIRSGDSIINITSKTITIRMILAAKCMVQVYTVS